MPFEFKKFPRGKSLSPSECEEIRAELEAARKLAGYTVSEFAAAANVNQGYLSKILHGHFKKVTRAIEECCKVAEQLNSTHGSKKAFYLRNSIQEAALKAWDGTPENANSILRILNELRRFKKGPIQRQ